MRESWDEDARRGLLRDIEVFVEMWEGGSLEKSLCEVLLERALEALLPSWLMESDGATDSDNLDVTERGAEELVYPDLREAWLVPVLEARLLNWLTESDGATSPRNLDIVATGVGELDCLVPCEVRLARVLDVAVLRLSWSLAVRRLLPLILVASLRFSIFRSSRYPRRLSIAHKRIFLHSSHFPGRVCLSPVMLLRALLLHFEGLLHSFVMGKVQGHSEYSARPASHISVRRFGD